MQVLPWWAGGRQFSPWSGKTPQAVGQLLSPSILEPKLCTQRNCRNEKPAHDDWTAASLAAPADSLGTAGKHLHVCVFLMIAYVNCFIKN